MHYKNPHSFCSAPSPALEANSISRKTQTNKHQFTSSLWHTRNVVVVSCFIYSFWIVLFFSVWSRARARYLDNASVAFVLYCCAACCAAMPRHTQHTFGGGITSERLAIRLPSQRPTDLNTHTHTHYMAERIAATAWVCVVCSLYGCRQCLARSRFHQYIPQM